MNKMNILKNIPVSLAGMLFAENSKSHSKIQTIQCPKICCQVKKSLEKVLCGHIFESS